LQINNISKFRHIKGKNERKPSEGEEQKVEEEQEVVHLNDGSLSPLLIPYDEAGFLTATALDVAEDEAAEL